MRKNLLHSLFYLFCLLVAGAFPFISCKKHKPADSTFFVRASTVSVATTTLEGTSSHKITDFWLYIDGKYQGAYPVGNLMPIVTKGQKVKIQVFAGIKNNGIGETRIPWNLYEKLEFDTLIENGLSIERPFTFVYNPGATFAWKENFDAGAGISLVKSSISDTTFILTSAENAFEGKSIEMGMKPSQVVAQIESTLSYSLPVGSSNVYLELNYKGDSKFEVGLIGDNTELKSALIVNPQTNWNKIYIQLSNAVSAGTVSNTYKVYFRVLNDGLSPKIYLDNIKLLYI